VPGQPPACKVNTGPAGPVQRPKLAARSEPALEPGSPLPLLSVPRAVSGKLASATHVSTVPVVVSLRVTRPALAWTAPPG
jgi:hypothetical protein